MIITLYHKPDIELYYQNSSFIDVYLRNFLVECKIYIQKKNPTIAAKHDIELFNNDSKVSST